MAVSGLEDSSEDRHNRTASSKNSRARRLLPKLLSASPRLLRLRPRSGWVPGSTFRRIVRARSLASLAPPASCRADRHRPIRCQARATSADSGPTTAR